MSCQRGKELHTRVDHRHRGQARSPRPRRVRNERWGSVRLWRRGVEGSQDEEGCVTRGFIDECVVCGWRVGGGERGGGGRTENGGEDNWWFSRTLEAEGCKNQEGQEGIRSITKSASWSQRIEVVCSQKTRTDGEDEDGKGQGRSIHRRLDAVEMEDQVSYNVTSIIRKRIRSQSKK